MAADYYETLGVSRTASEKEIRAAFRRLARKHHPDVNHADKDAEARFKEINEAHQVLSDPESRKKYDRYGANWKHADQNGRGRERGAVAFHVVHPRAEPARAARRGGSAASRRCSADRGRPAAASGTCSATCSAARRRTAATRRSDGRGNDVPTTISLEEAYAGTKRSVQVAAGSIRRGGEADRGEHSRRRRVRLAGARQRRRRNERGRARREGRRERAWVMVSPHPVFTRDGADLRMTADLPLVDAVLGGEIRAPLITGKSVALKIPPETQNGRVFRLTGKGMPRRRGSGHGDLLVTVKVVLPTGLTDDQRALFESLRESGKEKAKTV